MTTLPEYRFSLVPPFANTASHTGFHFYTEHLLCTAACWVLQLPSPQSCCLVAKSCPTLCRLRIQTWTAAHQAPLSMGFSRQGHWSGLPFPSPSNLRDPVIRPTSPSLQADSLPLSFQGRSSQREIKQLDSNKN